MFTNDGDDMYPNFSFGHSLSSEHTRLLHTKYTETHTLSGQSGLKRCNQLTIKFKNILD